MYLNTSNPSMLPTYIRDNAEYIFVELPTIEYHKYPNRQFHVTKQVPVSISNVVVGASGDNSYTGELTPGVIADSVEFSTVTGVDTGVLIKVCSDGILVDRDLSSISLTTIDKLINDPTMSLVIDNDTCEGINTSISTIDTTGVAGVNQVESLTVVGTITTSGDAIVQVTSILLGELPISVKVAVDETDDASDVASKVRNELMTNDIISQNFTISGSDANVVLTTVTSNINDESLNISIDNDTCTGLTTVATSDNTTPGVLGVSQSIALDLVGNVSLGGDVVITVTTTHLDDSPVVLKVPVVVGDTSSDIMDKVLNVLRSNSVISSFFTIDRNGVGTVDTRTGQYTLTLSATTVDELLVSYQYNRLQLIDDARLFLERNPNAKVVIIPYKGFTEIYNI